MNFGQMIYNLIRKKLGKIGINSSARNYSHQPEPFRGEWNYTIAKSTDNY